jgi:hypothetical protein
MAIKLTGNYAKRLGLPGYSSHQFSVSAETELTDLERVPGEVARLYQMLQIAVDREIQQTGFVPGDDYGLESKNGSNAANGTNGGNADNGRNGQGNGSQPAVSGAPNGGTRWQCSDKQRQLIAELTTQLGLSDQQIHERAQRLFGRPVDQLNKLSASGLISDLLEEAGSQPSAAAAKRNGGGA